MTRTKSPNIPQTLFKERSLSSQAKALPGGPSAGFLLHMRRIRSINSPARNKPGKIPAINKAPILVSVIIPKMIKMVLGGMRIPSVPPAAIVPVAKRELYLYLFISG